MIANIEFFSLPGTYRLFGLVCSYRNKILVCVLTILLLFNELNHRVSIKMTDHNKIAITFISLVFLTFIYSFIKYPHQTVFYLFRKYYYYLAILFVFPMIKFLIRKGNLWWFLRILSIVNLCYSTYIVMVKMIYSISGALLIDQQMQSIMIRNGLRMANSATFIMVSSIVCLATYFKIDRRKFRKISNSFLMSYIMGLFCVFYAAQTRASELALLAGSIVIIILSVSAKKRLVIFFSSAVLLGEIYRYSVEFYNSFFSSEFYSSTRIRIEGSKYFLSHTFDGGLLGMGLIGSPSYYHILFGPYYRYNLSDVGYFGFVGVYGLLGVLFLALFFVYMVSSKRRIRIKDSRKLFPEQIGYFVFIVIIGFSQIFTDPQRCLYLPLFIIMYWIIEAEGNGYTDVDYYFKNQKKL